MEKASLINELNQGRELTKLLKRHLHPLASSSPSPDQSCDFLIQKILSSYEKSLSLLNWGALVGEIRNEDSYRDSGNKKRKTQEVRVGCGTGLGPLDDGYSWRKYGQKDILGANFPRSYYRCTHRHVQGCLATKQVQRSDEDPSIFEVTYRGRHSCIQTPQVNPQGLASTRKEGPNKHQPHQTEENQSQSQDLLFEFGTDLKTQEFGFVEGLFPSFTFPTESENAQTNFFPGSLKEKNFLGGDSPAFLSPETLETSYFSLDQVEFDPNFTFDTSEFFS